MDCNVPQVPLDIYDACAGGRVTSNLGGLGPDTGAEEVRYRQIATHNGVDVDLVIKLAAGSPTFLPKQNDAASSSGCVSNNYMGRIQFQNGNAYTFDFEIQRNDNQALYALPGFSLYFNDLDGAAEWVSSTGMTTYTLDASTSVLVETSPVNPTFKATNANNVGGASDPNPTAWGPTQQSVAVGFHYEATSSWQVRLEIVAGTTCWTPQSGGSQVR